MALRSLPFDIYDTARVDREFGEWQQHGSAPAKRLVDIWTYCFVVAYYAKKPLSGDAARCVDHDSLVARALVKIDRSSGALRSESRYANWVSVICRNVYLNYCRQRRYRLSLVEAAHRVVAEPAQGEHDLDLITACAREAIRRLPRFLHEVASLRLLEERSYDEISRRTGKPVPVVRAYAHRAVKRLRDDRGLRGLRSDLGPSADP